MTFRSKLLVFLSGLTLALACESKESAPSGADDLEAPAAELMGLLAESKYTEFASRMHYPEIYTPDQLAEDRAGVVDSLTIVLREAGAIKKHERSKAKGPFLQVNVSGGNDSYWQTHPAGKGGSSVVFDVDFEKIGEGVVQIGFANTPDGSQVRNVGIGVEAARPDARATMEAILATLKRANVASASNPR